MANKRRLPSSKGPGTREQADIEDLGVETGQLGRGLSGLDISAQPPLTTSSFVAASSGQTNEQSTASSDDMSHSDAGATERSSGGQATKKDGCESGNESEEDVVIYRPRPIFRGIVLRQPHGPPSTLAPPPPRDARNFHLRRKESTTYSLTVASRIIAAATPTEPSGPTECSSSSTSGREEHDNNLIPTYSASLGTWRQRTGTANTQHENASSSTTSSRARPSTRPRSPFRPSQMWESKAGLRDSSRPGTNYQGDLTSKSGLATERNLEDDANCTLWIEGMPRDITYPAMFDWLEGMGIGPVWSLDIKSPEAHITTSAARLCFFEPSSARSLYQKAQGPEVLYLGGHTLKIMYNRSGNRARTGYETRVLNIQGPAELMTWVFWRSFFEEGIVFDLDRYKPVPCKVEGKTEMEVRFARVDGQAQTAIQKIAKTESMMGVVSARYGKDPCGS